MLDLTDQLRRAGAVARLDAILDMVRSDTALSQWPAAVRVWLARALLPVSGPASSFSIQGSALPDESELSLFVETLLEEFLSTQQDVSALKKELETLSAIREAAEEGRDVGRDEALRMQRLFESLRRRLLESSPPPESSDFFSTQQA